MSFGSEQTNPCAVFAYGEVEDYSLRIIEGTGFAEEKIAQKGTNNLTILPNPVRSSAVTVGMELAKGKNTFTLNGTEKLNRGAFMIVAEQNGLVIGRSQLLVE